METVTSTRTPEAFAALDEKYERLPIEWVVPSKTNPRTHFDEAYIGQLAASVAEKGVIEPLLVRPAIQFPCGHQIGTAYSDEADDLWNFLTDHRTRSLPTPLDSSTVKDQSISPSETIGSAATSHRARGTAARHSFGGSEIPGTSEPSTVSTGRTRTTAGSGPSIAPRNWNISSRAACPICASSRGEHLKPSSSSPDGSRGAAARDGHQVKTGISEPTSTTPTPRSDESSGDHPRALALVVSALVSRAVPIGELAAVFSIVAGECRYRASKQAGLTHLPCLIRPLTDEQALEHQLIENLHRKDLTPLEEASGFRALIKSNPDKHSAASIAERIGKSASWVWDLMKLLDLIPEAKDLLEQGRMTAGHAILIARLKPEDQKRVIHPDTGGLFEGEDTQFPEFDARPGEKRGRFDHLKVRTINELKDWIAHHIRFDVEHAAKAAPLQFEPVAAAVQAAAAKPGRGKKFVPITFDYNAQSEAASSDDERTYGSTAWKRADGQEKSKTCEYSVLGLVVAGAEHYGESFQVCIARDRCTVHWAESVKAKQQAAALREKGQAKKAAKVEKKAAANDDQKWKREQAERQAREKAWEAIEEHVIGDAVAQVKAIKTLTPALAKALLDVEDSLDADVLARYLGPNWYKTPATALLVNAVGGEFYLNTYGNKDSGFDQYVKRIAKPFGLDVKRLTAVRDKHTPKAEAVQASGVKKPAKKAKRSAA